MNIEVKKVVVSTSQSEETLAYTADVYIDGILSGHARNSGKGEQTDVSPYDYDGRQRIIAAEKWTATLPEVLVKSTTPGVGDFYHKEDLSEYIDSLVHQIDEKRNIGKFNKKLAAAMEDTIAYGIPDVHFTGMRYKSSIEEILKRSNGHDAILNTINKDILPALKEGELILNTNLPREIMDKVGVHFFHIPAPKQEIKPEKKQTPTRKRKGRMS